VVAWFMRATSRSASVEQAAKAAASANAGAIQPILVMEG